MAPGPRRTGVSLTSPIPWGNPKVRPQNIGPNALQRETALWSLAAPRGLCRAQLDQVLGLAELAEPELRLRVLGDQIVPRFVHAEQRRIDLEMDHRADER